MPLGILLLLVVGGIGGIALVLHMLGKSRVVPLDRARASEGWERHFPDDPAAQLLLAQNGQAALVSTRVGHGIVWQMGADTVACYLRGHQIKSAPGQLHVTFDDFGIPGVRITLSESEHTVWRNMMKRT